MLAQLACPSCKVGIAADGQNWNCPSCRRIFSPNRGVLSFLSPEERFNEGVYEEKQIANWSFTARRRDKIRRSKLLSLLNVIRIKFSLSGRRDRIFRDEMRSRRRRDFLILDLGCGGGRHYFKDYGKVVGIDPVLELLLLAREVYDEVYQCGGFDLPFADGTFDYVVSSDVLGHVATEQKDRVFSEMFRVLKPGGRTVHCSEADSSNAWFRFARKYPDLFQHYFVDMPGHIGLEFPTQIRQRFVRHGFREITFRKFSGVIQEPGGLSSFFDNEYKAKSRVLECLVAVDKLVSRSFVFKELLNFVLEPLCKLEDALTPLDNSPGALVVYEKPRA